VFSPSSKSRLTTHDLGRFPDDTLFHRIARVVCRAECLPRKELFEAWEVARRVRRRFRGGRVVDLCAGHGLLGQIMLLLDDTSPRVHLIDQSFPPSADTLAAALAAEWPRLAGRVTRESASLPMASIDATDVVVSAHACGSLTDGVIALCTAAGARFGVLPCCHALDGADDGGLTGWLPGSVAIDVTRAAKLRERGWTVWTQVIPEVITPQNRLLMASPAGGSATIAASPRAQELH
jgi:hypothetical protein